MAAICEALSMKRDRIVEGRCKNLKAYYKMLLHRQERVLEEYREKIKHLEESHDALNDRVLELEKGKVRRGIWPLGLICRKRLISTVLLCITL